MDNLERDGHWGLGMLQVLLVGFSLALGLVSLRLCFEVCVRASESIRPPVRLSVFLSVSLSLFCLCLWLCSCL